MFGFNSARRRLRRIMCRVDDSTIALGTVEAGKRLDDIEKTCRRSVAKSFD